MGLIKKNLGIIRFLAWFISIGALLFVGAIGYGTIKESGIRDQLAFQEIDPFLSDQNIDELISFQSPHDIEIKRSKIISKIWGKPSLPFDVIPSKIIKNHKEPALNFLKNQYSHVDKILFEMEYGIDSNIFLINPKKSNNKFILFYQGHSDSILHIDLALLSFLKEGYTIGLAFMPLFGPNPQPVVNIDRLGPVKMSNHSYISLLPKNKSSSIRYFLEPGIGTINYVKREYKFRQVSVIGFSGGGWTSVLLAALDPRIKMSVPVAGANPIFLRSGFALGDFEQSLPELYQDVNYLELFVMGSFGPDREQVRVYNKFDSCCFFGEKTKLIQPGINRAIQKLGAGSSRIFVDETHSFHHFCINSIKEIVSTMDKN